MKKSNAQLDAEIAAALAVPATRARRGQGHVPSEEDLMAAGDEARRAFPREPRPRVDDPHDTWEWQEWREAIEKAILTAVQRLDPSAKAGGGDRTAVQINRGNDRLFFYL